jgi:hypothetical protein
LCALGKRVGFAKFSNFESSPSALPIKPPCINHQPPNPTGTRTRTSAVHWLPPTQRLNPPQDRCREIFHRPWKSPNLQGTQIVHPFARRRKRIRVLSRLIYQTTAHRPELVRQALLQSGRGGAYSGRAADKSCSVPWLDGLSIPIRVER